ncbi:type II toxin-antitoxin system RelE/ParE family toxin [Bifidobacterium vespertilionis]|uniref:Type II toxin-antitoxin system YafQ family toxin n=1 Tax=Bifidobacterium vespertilionis TaxID=2562524 RepID=A0A5J5DT07_9BIFI|nr:type II toxin-antitoxin system YafQ family toxin [Bifidobacterium vespertilionis]KAA8817003.1 type II toxin-antitoxin system YafQ family toxin [Bifidobacterium vespertilionis]KAA8823775.1 type II toxin-antitoxin system YafQ family toxin [Bifidobacterium vespertilionis]
MLRPSPTSKFKRDLKRLRKRHMDIAPLDEVMRLILDNSAASIEELKRRHNMHTLSGEWMGSNECHVANAGDWLLIWCVAGELAIFQRTGSHDELFG